MVNKKNSNYFDMKYKTLNNMTDSSLLGFRKEGLEFLKNKYKKTTQDFIKETFPKKEWANWEVKISRLINKPKDSKENFTELKLAELLAEYFNKFRKNGDYYISENYFLGSCAYIDVVGASYGNAQVGLYPKKQIKKCAVPIRYNGYHGITSKNSLSNGMIRLFKPRNQVYSGADNRFGICQDKKSKIIWVGCIEPRSNGRYDVLDKSASTGKTIGTLVEDIQLSWSSRIEYASFPTYWDY
tara:strand:+ start:265 stop:987 length:723 start_codon:yes stop_codon:yes gene_type:complete